MQFALVFFTAIAGVLNTLQSGSNATLAKTLGQPVIAAAIIYGVGLVGVALAAPFVGVRWPQAASWSAAPWWSLIGGLLGAVYVFATLMAASKIGAAVFQGISVTAAVLTAVAMDHFGLMGFEQHSASLPRAAGALLMVGGLVLIAKY